MLIATVFLFTSCTDASRSKLGAYGDKHLVELYSGGKMVKSWVATGKVLNSEQSDGYYFRDEATGVNVEVSGDVVITRLED